MAAGGGHQLALAAGCSAFTHAASSRCVVVAYGVVAWRWWDDSLRSSFCGIAGALSIQSSMVLIAIQLR